MSLSKVMALLGRQRLTLFLEVVGLVSEISFFRREIRERSAKGS